MAKPIRSPVLGFNHNVRYRGRIFHVQTEESGPVSPRIFTHLYFGGTILASKKHEYDPAAPEDVVKALMQSQHKAILRELKATRYDERISAFFSSRGEILEPSPASGRDDKTLELALVPPETSAVPAPDDSALQSTFSDTFDDEPTSLDPPAYSAVSSPVDVILEETESPPETVRSVHVTARYPTVTGSAQEIARRRAARGTPALGAAVLIQRTFSVGGDGGAGGKGPQRSRRPAQSIPYVVKEGTHPLAETPAQSTPQLELPLPPVSAVVPVSATAAAVAPAPEPVADRSLDEVILAYLAGGENDQR